MSTVTPYQHRDSPIIMIVMRDILLILLGIDMIAVVAVLLAGAVGMTRGADPRRQNRLMRWRVGLQAVAVALVVILIVTG
uniref:twin transmembrane helix small protein n=1 Tax=Acidocella sp. C78 TaxID=1671486 RepID=UPI0020C16ACB|nr:twin transmembrane helix small protein [Acidocella sp. C78]